MYVPGYVGPRVSGPNPKGGQATPVQPTTPVQPATPVQPTTPAQPVASPPSKGNVQPPNPITDFQYKPPALGDQFGDFVNSPEYQAVVDANQGRGFGVQTADMYRSDVFPDYMGSSSRIRPYEKAYKDYQARINAEPAPAEPAPAETAPPPTNADVYGGMFGFNRPPPMRNPFRNPMMGVGFGGQFGGMGFGGPFGGMGYGSPYGGTFGFRNPMMGFGNPMMGFGNPMMGYGGSPFMGGLGGFFRRTPDPRMGFRPAEQRLDIPRLFQPMQNRPQAELQRPVPRMTGPRMTGLGSLFRRG